MTMNELKDHAKTCTLCVGIEASTRLNRAEKFDLIESHTINALAELTEIGAI